MIVNRLSLSRRTQIVNCLVEGNSIRSTERMTGTHRDTIMRLMVEVGTGCAALHDEQMRGLPCQRIQVDEIWSYVKVKQANIAKGTDRARKFWAFANSRSQRRSHIERVMIDGEVVGQFDGFPQYYGVDSASWSYQKRHMVFSNRNACISICCAKKVPRCVESYASRSTQP